MDTIWRILIYGSVGVFLMWVLQTVIRDAVVSAIKATLVSELEAIASELQEINERLESRFGREEE